MLREEGERFPAIVRTKNLEQLNAFNQESVEATIPAHSKVSVLLDMQTHTSGYPEHY